MPREIRTRATGSHHDASASSRIAHIRPLVGGLAAVLVAAVVAVAVLVSTNTGGLRHRPTFMDGASGSIEHQLQTEGGTSAPVHQGVAVGHLTLTGNAGKHVSVAIVCEGGGLLNLRLNGHSMGAVNCDSTYQQMYVAGFSLTAPSDSTVITLTPVKGQHWWAAISGPAAPIIGV